jgi:hypothetical protein
VLAQATPSVADKETARALMDTGDDRFEVRDYAGALEAYRGADAIMHLPMTGEALARAQAALGLLLEARDTALHVARLPEQPGENPKYAAARAAAASLADALAARIPSLIVTVSPSPAGLTLRVDDAPVPPAALTLPRKVNPGKHVVVARAEGFADARVEVSVAERAALPVALALVARAAPLRPVAVPAPGRVAAPAAVPARKLSPLVYVGFGVGGAGLLVGAVTGGLSLSQTAKLAADCNEAKRCAPGTAGADELASATTLANVSNVGLGVGVAGALTGVLGIFLSRRDHAAAPAIKPVVGPSSLGVSGVF